MAYHRFKLQSALATLATSATVSGEPIHTVAEVATVAGLASGNRSTVQKTVADVATVARGPAENTSADASAFSTDIVVALERAAARLGAKTGCSQQEVWLQARALVYADLLNDPRFFVRQADPNFCHVCGERENPNRPFVAVMSAKPDYRHWLHSVCHAEHVRRIGAQVEAAMAVSAPF